MAQRADHIITVSSAMLEDLVRHGWPVSKISVVWNGVDPERYDPAKVKAQEIEEIREKHGIPDDGCMLLFLGRLTWVKGVRNLVQAMPLILKDFPKTKLVILGKGEEQSDINDITNRLDIQENVECHFEFVSEKERIAHYAASDVCVFPSIYEPFGIVSLEAMSMAKPVVVGAQGVVGFREQVVSSGEDQNGVHVNGNDPTDIAWGIKEVLKDFERAKKWGENGRKRVLQYFTWRKAAEQTLQIYESLLSP
jgi:glycosyltransferase involved in cell wall biosynthesis